jgi:hypothetical protein
MQKAKGKIQNGMQNGLGLAFAFCILHFAF